MQSDLSISVGNEALTRMVYDVGLNPVLTVRTDDLDFVRRSEHLDIVVQRIQDRLAGKEEVVFPLNQTS